MVRLDRLAVKVRTWERQRIEALVAACGGAIVDQMPSIRWIVVEIDHLRAADVSLAYLSHPDVESAEFPEEAGPCEVVAYHAATADDMLDEQWSLKRMGVFAAWRYTKGSAAQWVGVTDTGITSTYASMPEFAGKSILALANAGVDPLAVRYHGTSCAAVVLGNAGKATGPAGIAPDCSLISVRFSSTDGASWDQAASALLIAADNGAYVINCSFGTGVPLATTPDEWAATVGPVQDAMRALRDRGVLIAFSASNAGYLQEQNGKWNYPAGAAHILGHLSVGCTTYESLDKPVRYSDGGATVSVAAPGDRTWVPRPSFSAEPNTRTVPAGVTVPAGWTAAHNDAIGLSGSQVQFTRQAFNGTSSAAPHVTGAAALILAANPALAGVPLALRSSLLATVDRPQSDEFRAWFTRPGVGVVNAARGVARETARVSGTAIPFLWPIPDDAVSIERIAGVMTTVLRGAVRLEITGFAFDASGNELAISNVKLYAGTDLVYDGAPRTTWDEPLAFAAARLDGGKRLRLVVTADNGASADEEYSDIVGYATSSAPPRTTATPAGGQVTEAITLTATGANPPFATEYRWNGGAWTPYTGPISPQSGTLEYRSTDCLGNREGG